MKVNKYRTIMISDITNDMVGKTIVVSGWVQNIRDVIPYPRTPNNCDY